MRDFPQILSFLIASVGVVLTAFGVYFITLDYKSTARRKHELRELDVLGVKLKVSRPMLLILVGIVVMLSPLIVDKFVGGSGTTDRAGDPARGKAETPVKTFSPIDTEEYQVLNDVRVFDLRSRVEVPASRKDEKISRVLQTRYTLLRKDKATDKIRYRYATSGVDLKASCITHDAEVLVKEDVNVNPVNAPRNLVKELELVIDVSDVAVGDTFVLICEAYYWNAFQGRQSEWAGALTEYKTEKMGILVLFKDKNDNRTYRRRTIASGSSEREEFKGEESFYTSGTNFYWSIHEPKQSVTYEIEWSW
jgi:hypothetical protein